MTLRTLAALALALPVFAQEKPSPWTQCDSEIPWLTDARKIRDNNQGGMVPRSDVDLDELVDKAKEQAKESGKLILWYVPQVQGSHMYRPVILDNYMKCAVWSDEAIVDLVKRRFVPLRAVATGSMSKDTGIKRWDVVEPAIVVLDAEGKPLHTIQRIRTFNADYIHSILRLVLMKHGGKMKSDDPDELIRGGEFERAVELIEPALKKDDPLACWRMARICRRMHLGDDALKLLDKAAKHPDVKGAAQLERGLVLLSMGRIDDAKTVLKSLDAPEATYHLALAERWSGAEASANERWAKLADASDTRWGWRASANVTPHKDTVPIGPGATLFEDVFWSDDSAYGLSTETRWSRADKDVDDIAKRAVTWLLRGQTSNGSWTDSRYAYWPSPKILPNVRMAVTSLAAAALLEWKAIDPKRCTRAVAAAEIYLLDDKNFTGGINEEVYAHSYRLLYLVRKHATLQAPDDKAGNVERMNSVIGQLAKIQDQKGFWAHEYPNPFCTAAAIQVLQLAKTCGAKVDDTVIAHGVEALKSTRGDGGRQAYGGGGPASPAKDSSTRSAMCEGALFAEKQTTREQFDLAFGDFWKYLGRRENIRVCDFHSDGELGGFFFFHGFFHTTEAAMLLDEKARDEHLTKAAAHILKMPEIDGAFLDSHEMGKSYGTAMALLSLKNARRFVK